MRLREDVNTARIDARYTVASFIKKAGGDQQLTKALQHAEQIGGPRFSSDGQACQIKLEIEGDRVAHELVLIAAANPDKSPLSASLLASELEDWRNRVFTGTGSSVSGAQVQFLRPPNPDDTWMEISDDARQHAVDTARTEAVHQVLDGIRTIPVVPGKTVGDALEVKSVHDSVSNWLVPVRFGRFILKRADRSS